MRVEIANEHNWLLWKVLLHILYRGCEGGIKFLSFRDFFAAHGSICFHEYVILSLYHSDSVLLFVCCFDLNFFGSDAFLDIYSRTSRITCQVIVECIISPDIWWDAVFIVRWKVGFSYADDVGFLYCVVNEGTE